MSAGEAAFQSFDVVFLLLVSLVFLLPFWAVIASSVANPRDLTLNGGYVLWPHGKLNFGAYRSLLRPGSLIYSGYKNTIFVTAFGTACNLLVTSMMAYGLSKNEMPGRRTVTMLVFLTMMFDGGMIPKYLVNKSLGLMNNRLVLVVTGLVSPWNMFLLRNFFRSLPEELEDAASIDGCGSFRTLIRIILPLSLPALLTIGLFYAVDHWNAWMEARIYLNDVAKLPLQNVLRSIGASSPAAIVVCTLPIMCVYPCIQKYFVQGVIAGSVKG